MTVFPKKQIPQQRPDGLYHPGVTDSNMGNTDQVPVYILCIYPKHSGGKSNNKIFTALGSWFYGGFKKRAKLSKFRISSTGQKLPEKWEVMVERIIDRVSHK